MSTPGPHCFLREDFVCAAAPGEDSDSLLAWARAVADRAADEDIYRARDGRTTLRFGAGDRHWFMKLHRGVGRGEILKNLLRGQRAVTDASNEYRAVRALERAGVATLSIAAYANDAGKAAARQSVLVTDALVDTVSLEDFCADWAQAPPPFSLRLQLLRAVAEVARRMHAAGINHRDFYLCHLHLATDSLEAGKPRLHLIDLHRAQLRQQVPQRWRIKDLAALYFSAMDCGLSPRDCLRFIRAYSGGELRAALSRDAALWRAVDARARRLYRKGNRG